MRKRVDQLGVAEPEIQRSGVRPDRRLAARRQERRRGRRAGRHHRPAVLLRLGAQRPRPQLQAGPTNANVTGGSSGGRRGTGARQPVRRRHAARRSAPTNTGKEHHDGRVLPRRHEDQAGPRRPRRDRGRPAARGRRTRSSASTPRAARSCTVPQGTIVVRAESADDKAPSNRFYVLQDQPALERQRHQEPRAELRQRRPARAASPTSPSTSPTRAASTWQKTTREIAQRGQESFIAGRQRADAASSTSRSCSTTSSSPRRTSTGARTRTASTARRLADLRRLHDQVRPGPGQPAEDRRAADQARADLVVAGLGDARQAGAAPGPDRRHRRASSSSRSSCSSSTACSALIAVGALVVYALYFFALIKLIPITMTLPGIAGLILTIGVAADANIVIFERVKEEMRGGQIRPGRDRDRLQQGPVGDRRRERRHVHGRVHPLHPRHRGRQGLRLHARASARWSRSSPRCC